MFETNKKSTSIQAKYRVINTKIPELVILFLFISLYFLISIYHEPWFDEIQSWQIAKSENLGRLLFYIPHYEGNPPLWYLILAIPAKLGVPFEIGLKSVGLLLSIVSVILLIFKSPFPRPVRLILPFTYFLFYQYAVIVRPYGLAMIAFMLVAITFKNRNQKPWLFVLCLTLLCETSSFCVVIAGGIAACWLYELIKEKLPLRKMVRDARFISLFLLLLFAILLTTTILPASDASFTDKLEGENSAIVCLLVSLFTALSNTLIVTSPWFSTDQTTLATAKLSLGVLVAEAIVQLIVFSLICCFSSKQNLKYFFIPYFCYCVFGSIVVLGGHYLGIAFGILLFWLWINCTDNRYFEIGRYLTQKLHFSEKDNRLFKVFAICFCAVSMVVSLFWTIKSSIKEIEYQYSYGRETVSFLKESGLINASIATTWYDENSETGFIDYQSINTMEGGWASSLGAYTDKNVVYNFNDGNSDANYVHFIRKTAEQNEATIELWKSHGIPDVLLGMVDVDLLTDGAVSILDYAPVYEMEINYIWKGNLLQEMQYIFVRNDLLGEYNLKPIERPDGMVGNLGFQITEEMRERYNNGEDIDDILKPYLDFIFGEESGK